MMEDKIKCLYYIKDLRSDKIIYIGQTINFKYRKYYHFGHKKQPVDEYMYNEGRDNFLMEMFNIDCLNMTDEEILKKEDELILKYNTIDEGFNIRRSGLIMFTENYNRNRQREYFKNEENHKRKNKKNKEYLKQYRETHREQINEYTRQCRLRKKINTMSE